MGLNRKLPHMKTAILPVELQRHASAPNTALFHFLERLPRASNFAEIRTKGRGGPGENVPGDSIPPWAAKPTRSPDFFTAKCESRLCRRTLPWRSAKADDGSRLSPAPAFGRPGGGENGALPYNARKSQFLRNGDVWATESLFLFAVLWLAFLPDQSETGVAGGGKARRPETPAAPRRPRPTTATGSRFLRRQRERPPRRPRPSLPAREGSLGAPNDRTFPPGAERKARKEKGKEEPRMKRAPPL